MPTSRTKREQSSLKTGRPVRDGGFTFVELLISIVLMGVAVVAVLAALQATVRATAVSRDHAKAYQWLQSAVGVVQAYDFVDCTNVLSDGPIIQQAYQDEVDARAAVPYGFNSTDYSIAVDVPRIWDADTQLYVPFGSQSTCYDDLQMRQQLIAITVTGPSMEESVEVVKRG